MKINSASGWSESLKSQTRKAIEQLSLMPDGRLHFKSATQGYAYSTCDDLCCDRLVLRSKKNDDEYRFSDVEALLQAGWALD